MKRKPQRKIKHDVKSVEYFLQSNLPKKHQPWVHFALTSEDVNNLSYSLMWKEAIIDVYLPSLLLVQKNIKSLAKKNKNISMLSLTHVYKACARDSRCRYWSKGHCPYYWRWSIRKYSKSSTRALRCSTSSTFFY